VTSAPGPLGHLQPGARETAGRWSVVPERSHTRFHVRDKLVTTVHGSLPIESGVVALADDATVTEGWLHLSAAGIETGHRRRDRDLTKPAFLDVTSSPTIRIEVEPGATVAEEFTARAVLHARGRNTLLHLTVRIIEAIDQRASDTPGRELRIRVTGRLDRRPLGIRAPVFVIGRFLDVEADLTFQHQHDPKPTVP
jgi:polyisoprenoid-binding protein YceI